MLLHTILSIAGGYASASTNGLDTSTSLLILFASIFEAAAVAFAVLYYKCKTEAEENEDMISRLSSENFNLKLEKKESGPRDIVVPLSTENIADFLRNEKASEVNISENSDAIFYSVMGEHFMIDCRRLPRMVIIRTDWGMKGTKIHYDIAERALSKVTSDIVMVKASADSTEELLSFVIVSLDHMLAAFSMNFDKYMSILMDAENLFREQYAELMKTEYPDECQEEEVGTRSDNSAEDIAMKIVLSSETQGKVKS